MAQGDALGSVDPIHHPRSKVEVDAWIQDLRAPYWLEVFRRRFGMLRQPDPEVLQLLLHHLPVGTLRQVGVAARVLRGDARAPGIPHACLLDSARLMRPQAAPNTAWSITGSRTFGVFWVQGALWTPVSGSQLDHPAPQASTPSAEPTEASSPVPPLSRRRMPKAAPVPMP